MKVAIYNLKNEAVGEVEVPDGMFSERWRPTLVAQVLTAFRANQRRPWAHAKGRGEVRGGGKKPWRQKGTGRARHGSIRSPLWVGGGKSHGPQKERNYEQKINKKMNRVAMFSALSKKLRLDEIKIIDGLHAEPKTKAFAATLRVLGSVSSRATINALLIPNDQEKGIFRAASNLPKVKAIHPSSLNVYDIVNYKQIYIDKDAIAYMSRHFTRQ
ncbi:MAG: 50S ribosomal protein L4 [Patescibacteria group bacterium]|nr:50S ribosomal protein L4 [Patescibacteria group bacterium]